MVLSSTARSTRAFRGSRYHVMSPLSLTTVATHVKIGVSHHVPCHPVAIVGNINELADVSRAPWLIEGQAHLHFIGIRVPCIGYQLRDGGHRTASVHLYAKVLDDVSSKGKDEFVGLSSWEKDLLLHARHIRSGPFLG